jgi:hypothetical protein
MTQPRFIAKRNMKRADDKLTYEFKDISGKERLRELILYIADKCSDDATFGAVKLNKILFFSDFVSYSERGKPITGVEYMKLPKGPAPRQLVPIRDQMVKRNEIAIASTQYGSFQQQRIVPLRPADLGDFGGEDIALVDQVITALWGKTATQVSNLSHQRAWRIAETQETIPYEAALLSDEPVTDYEINRVKALSKKYEWGT